VPVFQSTAAFQDSGPRAPALMISLDRGSVVTLYVLLVTIDLVLILATAATDIGVVDNRRFRYYSFDLKGEANIAVWYSSLLLAVTGFLVLASSARSEISSGGLERFSLRILSGGLLFLSMDETAQIHEQVGAYFSHYVRDRSTHGDEPVYRWIVPYCIPVAAFAITMIYSLLTWLRRFVRESRLILAGLLCWLGVIAAEALEDRMRESAVERRLQGVLEEGLELLGTTLFLVGFIELYRNYQRRIDIKTSS
jgi:hypothetical protein